MPYTVRSPEREDQAAIATIIADAWGPEAAVHRLGERYDLPRLPRLVIVAEDGAVVGTAGWDLLAPEFTDSTDGEWVLDMSEPPLMRGVLIDLAIDATHRRAGAGTMLLEGVLTRLRQTGLSEVLASLPHDNSGGLAFLQAAGFKPVATGTADAAAGPWPTEAVLSIALR